MKPGSKTNQLALSEVRRVLKAVFILFLFAGCNKDDAEKDSIPTLEEFEKISLAAGERNEEIKLADGSIWQYRISVPDLENGEKVPFLLNLHWSGNYDSYIESMRCLVEPAFKEKRYIIFSPRIGFGENWFEEETRERILAFLDLARQNWPIDTSKMAVTGYSLGGTGTWNYSLSYDNYFSAAIPMAGAYFGDEKFNIPVCVIHGTEDELYPYDLALQAVQDSRDMGSSITVITAEGRSHQEACLYLQYLIEAASWLENEVWQ
ncbi:hypothetical protein AB8P51_12325 [Muriicola sp. SD30]|uniref:carboxylesterase family protein n=1 Tax=Muriicola sp. SD30 TaxID=3240936 RepID=UPI00350FF001